MSDYYSDKLSAEKLRQCYDCADNRVRQYLQSEIDFVISHINEDSKVLELGCGYGRVLNELAKRSLHIVGLDTSFASLILAKELSAKQLPYSLIQMDAVEMGFAEKSFDLVVCIQNGLSAFKVDRMSLINETLRVTRPGGCVLLSSYSPKFWPHRLRWFENQSQKGLIGEINYTNTGDGIINCKDGFRADTITEDDFRSLAFQAGITPVLKEIDQSSLFCILHK